MNATTTQDEIRAKYVPMVTSGAAFLDKQVPGWFMRIDKVMLDFPSFACCVLGQMHGSYHGGLSVHGKDGAWGLENGFSMHIDDLCEAVDDYGFRLGWNILTSLWLAEIAKREGAL